MCVSAFGYQCVCVCVVVCVFGYQCVVVCVFRYLCGLCFLDCVFVVACVSVCYFTAASEVPWHFSDLRLHKELVESETSLMFIRIPSPPIGSQTLQGKAGSLLEQTGPNIL